MSKAAQSSLSLGTLSGRCALLPWRCLFIQSGGMLLGNRSPCSRIPRTAERGGLPSLGSHRVGHNWSDLAAKSKGKVSEVKWLSHVRLFATPWTIAYQAPQFMEFSRQENWSGLPFPSPWDLPDPGIEPRSPTLRADTLPSEPPGKSRVAKK